MHRTILPALTPSQPNALNRIEKYRQPFLIPLLILFWPLTALVLFCDSVTVARYTPHGQMLSMLLALGYIGALLLHMNPQRRLLALLFVPLSGVGEIMFSLWFGLYQYRLEAIPWYVPLGHSILLSVGLMLSELPLLNEKRRLFEHNLTLFHVGLVAGTLLLFRDTLSAVLIAGFLLMLPWMRNRIAYLLIGVLVLYVELLGTYWRCWTWGASPFGVLQTTNPPTGAFACYVLAELIALKYAGIIEKWWTNRRIQILDCKPLRA